MKSLNFSATNPRSNLDMVCAVESVVSKLPQTLGMEFRWKMRSMLEKSKSSMSNMTKKKLKAIKSLRLNKDTRILHSDEGNCMVVLDEVKCKARLNTLLQFGVYEPLPKSPTAKVERKYRNSSLSTKLLFLQI
jgi:hypothetical protein